MYRVVYRILSPCSVVGAHVYEKYVPADELRELIDWIDDNDEVELVTLKHMAEQS